MNQLSLNRKEWIDGLKGLGIVLMVIGHSNPPFELEKLIYGFHMPLFFAIAGYLYNEMKWNKLGIQELANKRFRYYIGQYFFYGCCNLILNFGVEVLLYNNSIKGGIYLFLQHTVWLIYSYGRADKMPNCTPLWFLPCIFLCTIFFYFLARIKNKFIKLIIYAICFGVELLLINYKIFALPWNLHTVLLGIIFMEVGYQLKGGFYKEIKWYNAVVMVIIASIMINRNIRIDMNTNCIGNPFLFFGGAILSIIVLMRIAPSKFINNKVFVFLGKNTIIVMAFNYFINTITEAIWIRTIGLRMGVYPWWLKMVVVLSVCAMLIWIKNIERKYRDNEKDV